MQWLELLDLFGIGAMHCLPQFARIEQVDPELRRCAQHAREPKCRIDRHAATSAQQIVEPLERNAQPRGKSGLGHAERYKEIFAQYFTRMSRRLRRPLDPLVRNQRLCRLGGNGRDGVWLVMPCRRKETVINSAGRHAQISRGGA